MLLKNSGKIMHNRLYKYLTDNSILYKNQFGFRAGHYTKHAIIQQVHQVRNSFESKQYMLGFFVDLSKAFDIVNQNFNFQSRKLGNKREELTLVYQLLNKWNNS